MSELDSLLEQVSGFFSVLSEPTRLKIIRVLCDGEKSVNDIVEGVESTQSNVSRHLNLMYRAGVLSRRKEGTLVMYQVKEPTVVELCRTVCVHVAAKMDSVAVESRQAAEVFRQGNM
ncbi:metalloregulator ArsR/SmtB family transcription factor [Limnobacter humi]|uniref:Metalloregulator ArsR/SmtB family transcription factor n=1 Tax=Limnobacter humi TaxID=1778671 RepID=A0ABT1WJT7_9BURK|nr:metalloregulator ArsR/SmtB family transcription factor [Limnobacter humi]MCQ8897173.1 metalloregulator ArsR/SmtB family transcription factor [Limnobacter humi]